MRRVFNKHGMAHVKTAAMILILSMLFSVLLAYASLMSTVSRARDDTQRVLDSYCIEKAEEIYGSIKNGHKQMATGIYTAQFLTKVVRELGLTQTGPTTVFHGNGRGIIFRYTNPLTANLDSDTLSLTTEFELVLPVVFAGKSLLDLRIPLKVESVYVLNFE